MYTCIMHTIHNQLYIYISALIGVHMYRAFLQRRLYMFIIRLQQEGMFAHTEKSFLNLVKLSQILIVITLFR